MHTPTTLLGLADIMSKMDSEELLDVREAFADSLEPGVNWNFDSLMGWLSACRPKQIDKMLGAIERELQRRHVL